MKAFQIGAQTGIASLTATTRPEPVAGPGEVIVKPLLLGIIHRDLLLVSGTYGPKQPDSRIPMSEGVGEVVAVGEGVTTVRVGDRVICAHFATWIDGAFSPAVFADDYGVTRDGWLAERIRLPGAALIRVPDAVSDIQAAVLASSGLTAWNALVEVGGIKAGDLVLTLGTGGVSIYTLKIAKAHGARVAITSSSDEKLALARGLGADYTINYRTTPDWEAELLRLTGGAGADIIIENGGPATLAQSIDAAAPNGRIIVIGGLAGATDVALPNYTTLIVKNLTVRGIAEGSRAMLVRLLRAVAANDMTPVIDRIFPFDQAPDAYRYLQSAQHVGKVLIQAG